MTSAATFTAGEATSLWSTEGALTMYTQSVLSTQYVPIPVTMTTFSGATGNPTGDPVAFSFTPVTYPVTSPTVWVAGTWATFPGPAYRAACLVGPGTAAATALTIGTWQTWVKITDNPEVPVLQPSLLQITP